MPLPMSTNPSFLPQEPSPLLEELDLSGLNLDSLPQIPGELGRLKRLYLQNNQLTSLPHWVERLESLEEIHLDGNRLVSIPATFVVLAALQEPPCRQRAATRREAVSSRFGEKRSRRKTGTTRLGQIFSWPCPKVHCHRYAFQSISRKLFFAVRMPGSSRR